MTEDGRRKKNN